MIGALQLRSRRKTIAGSLGGGLIVLTGYELMQQANDMAHPFRQEANFLYLSGINEPGWKMIYDGMRDRCWLVRPELSTVEIVFGGELSDEAACQQSGADAVITLNDLDATLRQLTRQHASVYTIKPTKEDMGFVVNPAQKHMTSRLERIFANVSNFSKELSNIRAIKAPEELMLIKRAIAITGAAFNSVRNNLANYTYEYEVEAEFWLQFRKKNAVHAYSPIIASGNKANILHYEANSQKLSKRSLMLMDCGASVGGYSADITRTLAIGEPSEEQRKAYAALLRAHQDIIKIITPGLSFREYSLASDIVMKRTLCSLDIMKDENDDEVYRKYFPHAVSHGLGIDVHEGLGAGGYFKPGMVLTVEPGIYIPEKKFGMRVEDNILVTDKGRQNLSKRISTALE